MIEKMLLAAALAWGGASLAAVPEPHTRSDATLLNDIADAGFNHSEVPQTIGYLADQIGGRMTNSPAMRKAERWTQERFRAWGLKNVHTEGFSFGRGWWIESNHVRMLAPRPLELLGIPVAWTPPTNGAVSAPIIVAPMASEKDFAQWKGKLSGKIVLVSWPAPHKDEDVAPTHRFNEADITKRDHYDEANFDPDARVKRIEKFRYAAHLDAFLAQEGALVGVKMSYRDGRLVHGEGYSYRVGASPKVPLVELAAEDYRRLTRLAKSVEVRLEIENKVHYDDSDANAYNVFAEIPGNDKSGYVMAGAHLDSWVAADGAADNGAGSVMIMEAARILASLHYTPKRSVRFVLWSGEEQGLLGSAAYVDAHLAKRPPPPAAESDLTPSYFLDSYPVQTLPGFAELAAYFNIDNGSGKLRGIYTEGNLSVVPLFREWLAPFASMQANNAIVAEQTGGTDHVYLSRLGLPAFQFVQDPLDYGTRTHHSDLDTYDHLRIDDMRQGAVILATMLVRAAEADKPLPRRPVPTQPTLTDPFKYADPSEK